MIVFGTGTLYGIPLTDAAGTAISNPTPRQFGQLQEISADLSFDEKVLHGNKQFPVAFGRGKGKFSFQAKMADFNIEALSALYFGRSATAGIKGIVDSSAQTVPASTAYTITVTPPSSGTFVTDLGVRYASTGIALTRVASAPSAGQYSLAGAVYTFAAADASTAVLISYEYSASSTSKYSISLTNELMGYAPEFKAELSVPYRGEQLILTLNKCVSSKIAMPFKNEDFSIMDFDFQALADASDNIGVIAIR